MQRQSEFTEPQRSKRKAVDTAGPESAKRKKGTPSALCLDLGSGSNLMNSTQDHVAEPLGNELNVDAAEPESTKRQEGSPATQPLASEGRSYLKRNAPDEDQDANGDPRIIKHMRFNNGHIVKLVRFKRATVERRTPQALTCQTLPETSLTAPTTKDAVCGPTLLQPPSARSIVEAPSTQPRERKSRQKQKNVPIPDKVRQIRSLRICHTDCSTDSVV